MTKRKYTLKRRAERQERTRRRIVQATVELHSTIGPSQTTIRAIADQAGVQRLTVYRHFPNERALFAACSGYNSRQNPLPDPTAWKEVSDPAERLERGLTEIYDFYRRQQRLLANVHRDAETMPVVRWAMGHFQEKLAEIREVLVSGWPVRKNTRRLLRAAIAHALHFRTWESLALLEHLSLSQAVRLMVAMVRDGTDCDPPDTKAGRSRA